MQYPMSDADFSRRLERCEATSNAATVESRAHLDPGGGATWIDVNGTYAMYDHVDSPLTQTFGFGLFSEPTEDDLAKLEEFFLSRGAPVFHEVSPLADPKTLEILGKRYRPVELTSVLYQPIVWRERESESRVTARLIVEAEEDLWASTVAEGWKDELPEIVSILKDLGRMMAHARGAHPFLAELDGRPIAAGGLFIYDGVAILAGASTILSERNQGAQRALLEARLRFAADHGCDLAMMGAAPGSASQRNAERQGFRIAYTRTKWGRVSVR